MKKFIAVLAAAVFLLSSFAFASGDPTVTYRIKEAFSKDFSSAANVSWEKIKNGYIASFTLNGNPINAAYNEQGELVGTSRELQTSQVPVVIALAIAKKYEGYAVSAKTLELTFEGETSYYFSAENEKLLLKLKSSVGGNISVEEKVKKK